MPWRGTCVGTAPPRLAAEAMVGVRIDCAEETRREQVQRMGGKWNRSRKVWELRYEYVVALMLETRIVEEKASHSRYQC